MEFDSVARFVEHLPVAASVIAPDGVLLAVNHELARLAGAARPSVVGARLTDLVEDDPASVADHLRIWGRSVRPLPAALRWRATGVACRCDGAQMRGLSADRPPIFMWCVPRSDANQPFALLNQQIEALMAEVRERQKAEAALMESQRRLLALFEYAQDAIFFTDNDGRCVEANPAAVEMTGYSPGELRSMSLLDLAAPAQRPAGLEQWSRFLALGSDAGELEILRKDGQAVVVDYRAVARILPGLNLVVLRDITERKRAEQELARTNADLQEFGHITAHDLKEPLRGMQHLISFLVADHPNDLPHDVVERLDRLRRLANRMHRLLEAMLEYSALARAPFAPGPVDAGAVLAEAVAPLKPWLAAREAQVLTPEPLPTVMADRSRLRRIFGHLIVNAVMYNDAPAKRVEVGAVNRGGLTAFVVRDNGVGLDPEQAELALRLFKRLRGAEQYSDGPGMGLAVVKKAVERHGGRVWFEPAPTGGTAVYFTLQPDPQGPRPVWADLPSS